MKKVFIFGEKKEEIAPLVTAAGFSIVENAPDLIMSYGGDGTFMRAEAAFPGVPKLILKGSRICNFCMPFSNDELLRRIAGSAFTKKTLMKLDVTVGAKTLTAVNDVVVHNADPRHAIRYRLSVEGKAIGGEIIGDGIVVATPLGATGYYRSITDSVFEVGIGIAFNNSMEQSDHLIVREESAIEAAILRGPAMVYVDNQAMSLAMEDGDRVSITRSSQCAVLLVAS